MAPHDHDRPQGGAYKNPTGASEADGREPKSFGADDSRPGEPTAGPAAAEALPPEVVAERADIAADDVGASAFAEAAGEQRTGRLDDDESNPTTEGSGAMASDVQGREVDPGAG
jgi:hypothetical protein